jgi:2'-5' RNA ligase
VKRTESWKKIVRYFDGIWGESFGTDEIGSIDLMESELKPSGPVYTRLERIEL